MQNYRFNTEPVEVISPKNVPLVETSFQLSDSNENNGSVVGLPKMSAFELFSGFSENEVNYLESNLLHGVKAAFK